MSEFLITVTVVCTVINVAIILWNLGSRRRFDRRMESLHKWDASYGEERTYFLLMTGFKLAVKVHIPEGIEPNAWRAATIALHNVAHQVLTGHTHSEEEDREPA